MVLRAIPRAAKDDGVRGTFSSPRNSIRVLRKIAQGLESVGSTFLPREPSLRLSVPKVTILDRYVAWDVVAPFLMGVGLLAFALLSLIVYCGIWLANTMAQLRADQDCVLMGRTNCAPIKVPVEPR